ncbi:MAG: hypothetical protein ABL982_20060, partial [Vicinamibacterales bacterium]
MPQSPFPTQTPLNLIMPLKPGAAPALRALLTGVSARQDKPVERALVGLGNVHHAQFVFLENDTRLGVLTWYDGTFDDYIVSFVEHIGGIFNAILQYVDGADALIPVETHRDAFLAFIAAHDYKCLHAFSAYPGRRLFDIKDALGI